MRNALIVVAAAAALVAAGGAAAQAKRFNVQQAVATTSFAFLPVYVAEHAGLFAEEGVTLATLRVQSAAAGVAAAANNNAQYYLSTPAAGARATAQGANVRIFAALMTQYPGNIVVSAEIAQKHRLTDQTPLAERLALLKGLRMAAHSPGSAPDQLLRYIVRQQGWNPEADVTILPITDTSILAALENKRIDGFSYSSPLADTAVAKQGARLLLSLASGEYPPLAGLLSIVAVGNADWLQKEPEAAAAVTRAIWRAMQLMRTDVPRARAAAAKAFPNLEPQIFDIAFDANRRAFPESPAITRAMMEAVYDFHVKTGGEPIKAKPEETFTTSAVDLAGRTLKPHEIKPNEIKR